MGSKMATPCTLEKLVKQVLTSFMLRYKVSHVEIVTSCIAEPYEYFCRVGPRHDLFWERVMTGDNLSLQRTFGCRLCYGEHDVWCPVFDDLGNLLGFLAALTGGETKGRTVQRLVKLFTQPTQRRYRRFSLEVHQ